MAEHWMQSVKEGIEKRGTKGALTRQAAVRGETPAKFCSTKRTGKAGKRCALRKAFGKSRHTSGRS